MGADKNQRPGSSATSAPGALHRGVSMGEGVPPGAPRDHPGSPGAPSTGASVAALRSPAETGRALSGRRPSSSASPPPKDRKADLACLVRVYGPLPTTDSATSRT